MQIVVPTHPYDLCVTIPPTAFTVAGFETWLASPDFPDRGRIDLCEGEVWST